MPWTRVPSSPQQTVLWPHQSCGILGAPHSLSLHGPQGAASWVEGRDAPQCSWVSAPRPKWSFLGSLEAVTTGPNPASQESRVCTALGPKAASHPSWGPSSPAHAGSAGRGPRLRVGGVSRVCPSTQGPSSGWAACHASVPWSVRMSAAHTPSAAATTAPRAGCTACPSASRHFLGVSVISTGKAPEGTPAPLLPSATPHARPHPRPAPSASRPVGPEAALERGSRVTEAALCRE